jgi:hypothetical protein
LSSPSPARCPAGEDKLGVEGGGDFMQDREIRGTPGGLEKAELRELLVKCWMSHDGAWFYHCVEELGIETANRINQAAIRTLAKIELPRVTGALAIGTEGPVDFNSLRQVIDGMFSVVKGDFMDFTYDFPAENTMTWRMRRCFAYEGMKRMGVSDRYQCGLVYRVGAWVEILGVEYEIDPPISGCMMHEKGRCTASFRFRFAQV